MVGRDCYIGPGASVTHALLGNRVVIHAGVRIGQDGFGFAMSGRGHLKVPQIGRVIIQDDVEIGANTCIDRGALKDTVIGEGTKIDNLVQIGHNAVLGRHCVIVGQAGIAGSATLEDFVVMGGQSGVVGHVRIGQGAQIAGGSHVNDDVHARQPAGRDAGPADPGLARGEHGLAATGQHSPRMRPSPSRRMAGDVERVVDRRLLPRLVRHRGRLGVAEWPDRGISMVMAGLPTGAARAVATVWYRGSQHAAHCERIGMCGRAPRRS